MEPKSETSRRNAIQMLKRRDGVTRLEANLLVECVRKAGHVDFSQIEKESQEPLSKLSWLADDEMALIRMLRSRTPNAALRWLASLSPEEIASIRIARNCTLDGIYGGNDWQRLSPGGAILSGTVMAYPAAYSPMPAKIEHCMGYIRSVIDTSAYAGERSIALAFDDFEVSFSKDGKSEIHIYRPKGPVTVLSQFPQRCEWMAADCDTPVLGLPGGIYLERAGHGWVGQIFRTHSEVDVMDGLPANEHKARRTIYAKPSLKERFGLVLEAVLSQNAAALPHAKEPAPETVRFVGPMPSSLPPEKEKMLRRIAETLTLAHITMPETLRHDSPPVALVGKEFALIAQGNARLAESIKPLVSMAVGWTYLQNKLDYTVEDFARSFWKICGALGVADPMKK
jgi:hypothetical protein